MINKTRIAKAEIIIPEQFKHVQYNSSRIPGVENQEDLSLGANCQVFAYAFLRYHGIQIPNFRSSNLWEDNVYTEKVSQFRKFDLMLYHKHPNSFGAHVGVFIGNDQVFHLSKSNGVPKIELHHSLMQQEKYQCFIGAKRVKT